MSDVPEITITTHDQALLSDIKARVAERSRAKGVNPEDISDIGGNRTDGITLRLNTAEALFLFKGDPILDGKLGLSDTTTPHTNEYLRKTNERLASSGITLSRQPPLDDEFRALVAHAEVNVKQVSIRPPTAAANFDELYNAHQVIAVGENHLEESARLSIAGKLPELAATGGALVMEGVPKNRQGMIDEYLHSPSDKIPPLLSASLHAHTADDMMIAKNPDYYSAERLLADAKKAKVPVYAFDSDATLLVNYGNRTSPPLGKPDEFPRAPLDYRLLTMNQAASDTVAEIQKKHKGKILINVGGAHTLPENGIPGIGDYVGGGQVVMYDGNIPGGKITRDAPEGEGITRGDYLSITTNPAELKQRQMMGKAADVQADPFSLSPLSIPASDVPTQSAGSKKL